MLVHYIILVNVKIAVSTFSILKRNVIIMNNQLDYFLNRDFQKANKESTRVFMIRRIHIYNIILHSFRYLKNAFFI